MNVRERMAQYPAVAASVGIVCIVVLVVVLYQTATANSVGTLKALYSDDDGKSWFRDDLRKLPPFEHGGKQAYRVQLFHCGSGPRFVGWLESYTDDDKKKLESVHGDDLALASIMSTVEPHVKRPGEMKWTSVRDRRQYDDITTPRCPGGATKDTPEPVGPQE